VRLATLVLFLSALLLPLAGLPVQADDGPLLTARQAEWQDAQGDAGLLALRDLDGAAGAGLSASSIHVREVMADLYAYARGPTGDAFVAPQWTVHESDLSGASLRVTPGRPGSFLYLLPSSPGAVSTCRRRCG
jgi:hypothetical protein